MHSRPPFQREFGRERAIANSRRVGLGDSETLVYVPRVDSRTVTGVGSTGHRRGNEGVSTLVYVKHSPLGSLQ